MDRLISEYNSCVNNLSGYNIEANILVSELAEIYKLYFNILGVITTTIVSKKHKRMKLENLMCDYITKYGKYKTIIERKDFLDALRNYELTKENIKSKIEILRLDNEQPSPSAAMFLYYCGITDEFRQHLATIHIKARMAADNSPGDKRYRIKDDLEYIERQYGWTVKPNKLVELVDVEDVEFLKQFEDFMIDNNMSLEYRW